MNGPLVDGGDVGNFAWSPDGTQMAYIADQEVSGVPELFVANADGTAGLKVHPNLSSGQEIRVFRWAPDGTKIAYLGDQDMAGVFELYTVDPDGENNQPVSDI
ncbi:MAG: hypothetical protein AAFX94_26110, partial [Myxococcota bacterium]